MQRLSHNTNTLQMHFKKVFHMYTVNLSSDHFIHLALPIKLMQTRVYVYDGDVQHLLLKEAVTDVELRCKYDSEYERPHLKVSTVSIRKHVPPKHSQTHELQAHVPYSTILSEAVLSPQ